MSINLSKEEFTQVFLKNLTAKKAEDYSQNKNFNKAMQTAFNDYKSFKDQGQLTGIEALKSAIIVAQEILEAS